MGQVVFNILSTAAALYAAYLLIFCLYRVDHDGNVKERVTFPRIVYIIVILLAPVPLLNLLCVAMFLAFLAMCSDSFRVKSWLFEKPGRKEKPEEGKL